MKHFILAAILVLSPLRVFQYFRPVTLEVTAYVDEDGIPPRGITASGTETRHGIAAAPPEIPFGVKLYVPSYGWAEVQDRGGAIQGKRLDLWHSTRESALEFGRRELTVWVPIVWPEVKPCD